MTREELSTVTVILILNTLDVFAAKLQENNDLHHYFEEYTGGNDVVQGVEFIKSLFIRILEKSTCLHEPVLYIFEGSMIDAQCVQDILNSMIGGLCKPTIVNRRGMFEDDDEL